MRAPHYRADKLTQIVSEASAHRDRRQTWSEVGRVNALGRTGSGGVEAKSSVEGNGGTVDVTLIDNAANTNG